MTQGSPNSGPAKRSILPRAAAYVALALSLVVPVATCRLWLRTSDVSEEYESYTPGTTPAVVGTLVKFCSAAGGMDFEVHRFTADRPLDPPPDIFEFQRPAGSHWVRRLGYPDRSGYFDFFWLANRKARGTPGLTETKFSVAAPHWFVCLLAALPALAFAATRAVRMIRRRPEDTAPRPGCDPAADAARSEPPNPPPP